MKRLILALTLVVGAWPATSQAAPLFFDDFNTENGGVGQLNYTGFQKWDVLPGGGVDLIPLAAGGAGPYDFLAGTGHGQYVDLDGTPGSGKLQLKNGINLGPGNYALKFFLAGNNTGEWTFSDTVSLDIFGSSTTTIPTTTRVTPPTWTSSPITFTVGARTRSSSRS